MRGRISFFLNDFFVQTVTLPKCERPAHDFLRHTSDL